MDKYCVVVGGLNLDIAGLSGGEYRERDSNIGTIGLNAGGVGQNIANNMATLNIPTYLISVYGDDYFGSILEKEVSERNINMDYSEIIDGERSSTFLYVNDDEGDMVTAVNDMKIIENITPEFLEKRIDFINGADIVVLDANIPKPSIDWLLDNCKAPIFVDPVSVAKVGRFADKLDKIDTIKPNAAEAQELTGIRIRDEESAIEAAKSLYEKGVKNTFISLGALGIVAAREGECSMVTHVPTKIVSTNGAGDATMATIVWARYNYNELLPLKEIAQFTQAAASITLESEASVSPDLNVRNIIRRKIAYFGEKSN